MSPRSLLIATSALLVIAVIIVIYGSSRPQERTFHGKLLDVLPEAPPGWTRTLRPIADTPEMHKKADELLNFDDGVFVDYSRGSDRLSVYIAYWTPGRMSHPLVAGHTPDVCWVGSGWTCTERGVWSGEVRKPESGNLKLIPHLRSQVSRLRFLPRLRSQYLRRSFRPRAAPSPRGA